MMITTTVFYWLRALKRSMVLISDSHGLKGANLYRAAKSC